MKLQKIRETYSGKYLNYYELSYENRAGREKKYEIVSRRKLAGPEDLGAGVSGVSIIATRGDELLLLREFRMGVGRTVYNLCAGMTEKGESIPDCIARELYEETGLRLTQILDILPASFSAIAISDVKTCIAFVRVEGELSDHTSENEETQAGFYTREQVRELIAREEFSSRAQLAAYFFAAQGSPFGI